MKAILRSINNFSCKLKQINNLKYNISPKIRSNKFKSISGNGNIVIEDALNKYLKDYRVYGNTYQNSTTGKNKYGITSAIPRVYGSGLPMAETSNLIVDEYDLNNIKFHTKATGLYLQVLLPTYQLEPNTFYTISYTRINDLSSSSNYPRRFIYSLDNENNYTIIHYLTSKDEGNMSYTFKTTETGKVAIAFGFLNNASVNSSEINNLMIRLATDTDDTFEPYTNGPSPNPDYPQEIVSCGDRTNNLFLTPDTPSQSNLSTYSKINNNSFTLYYNQTSTTSLSPFVRIEFDITQFKPNTRYTISKKHTVSGTNFKNAGAIRSYINGSNGSVITGDSFSFTTPNEITSLGVYFYLGYNNTIQGESTITFYDIQVEENSSVTEFEPYGYKIPVNVRSDNLISETIYQTNTNLNDNGEMVSNNNYFVMKQANIKPLSKYILSENQVAEMTRTNNTPIRVCAYDKNDNFISLVLKNVRTEVKRYIDEFIIPANTDYILIGFRNTDTNIELIESIDTNIYLDEPLRKIDGYSDYIDFINGKVVRQLGEVILDGNETWQYTNNVFYSVNAITDYKTSNENICLCNKYLSTKNVNNSSLVKTNNTCCFYINTTNIRLYIRDERFTSISDFKEWLSQNNVTVDYVLETPTEESITLPNIKLIEGKNIISIGTEVQGVFEVEYYSKEIIDISDYKYNLRKVED